MDLEATIQLIGSLAGRTIRVESLDAEGRPEDVVRGILRSGAEDVQINGLPFVRFRLEGRDAFVLPRIGFLAADHDAESRRVRITMTYGALDVAVI